MATVELQPITLARTPYASSKNSKAIQKTLLVIAVAFGALSLITPLRFAGSMGLRTTAFLSSCNLCAGGWTDSTKLDRAILVGKVTLVALGIIGSVLLSPAIIVASVAADTALQVKALASALNDKKYDEALVHLTMILINTLVIAAIVAGSWKLIVAASAISAVFMFGIGMKVALKENGACDWVDIAAYMLLGGIGIVGCLTMAPNIHRIPEKVKLDYTNNSAFTRYVYGKDGHLIATLAPGESVHLELPFDACNNSFFGDPHRCYVNIVTPDAPSGIVPHNIVVRLPTIDRIEMTPAIAKSDLPFTPFSSTAIVTKESH